jgi:hypothetical protein
MSLARLWIKKVPNRVMRLGGAGLLFAPGELAQPAHLFSTGGEAEDSFGDGLYALFFELALIEGEIEPLQPLTEPDDVDKFMSENIDEKLEEIEVGDMGQGGENSIILKADTIDIPALQDLAAYSSGVLIADDVSEDSIVQLARPECYLSLDLKAHQTPFSGSDGVIPAYQLLSFEDSRAHQLQFFTVE